MLISRLIIIWIFLLDSFNLIFMHEIEEKFTTNSSKFKRNAGDLINIDSMVGSPRQTNFGGLSFLSVSLLFQLPLMEIVFVMGLVILVLGIMLHFVELKADFFRLRRQFFKEEKRRLQQLREELRNRTLAMQNSNSSGHNPHYENYHKENLYGQYSHNLPFTTYRRPPFPYRQPNRQFPRFPPLRSNNFRHQFMNPPNFQRPRFPQRLQVPNYRRPNIRRQGYQHYSQKGK